MRRVMIVAGVCMLIAFLVGYFSERNRSLRVLARADRVEVFRIDPDDTSMVVAPGEQRIGGYRVLSQGRDRGPEFAAKLTEVLSDGKTYTGYFAFCYSPGVNFRAWSGAQAVDILICFKCENFYMGAPTTRARENAAFMRSPNKSKLVALAKEAFPDDPEIQALE